MVYLNNLLHKIAIVRITELDSALRIMCFNTLLNNIGSVAMVSTWSVYVTGILKFSTLWLTVSGCAMAAGMMIGSACCGTITDRLEPRSVICASNICFGMCMVLLCFITDPAAITILLAMSGLSSSFYHPARSILIVRYTPSDDILLQHDRLPRHTVILARFLVRLALCLHCRGIRVLGTSLPLL